MGNSSKSHELDVSSLRPCYFDHWGLEGREGQEAESSGPLEVTKKAEEQEGAGCFSTQGGGYDQQDFLHLQ